MGHTHEVTVGHVAEGVARRAHLLVHLHSKAEIETATARIIRGTNIIEKME